MKTEINIRITEDKLNELRMLADWQVARMGIDPDSVRAACLQFDESPDSPRNKRCTADRHPVPTTYPHAHAE